MEAQFSVKIKTSFSRTHLLSATYFAEKALEIEKNTDFSKKYHTIPAESTNYEIYCTNSILASVYFLEAYINEFYCDIRDGWNQHKKRFSPEVLRIIKELWNLGIPRTASYPILRKYEIALLFGGKEPFDTGIKLYQNISTIIQLRNALVHYESDLIEVDEIFKYVPDSNYHKLEKRLKKKFETNPFHPKSSIFFPDKCISYGCAVWSIENALQFVMLFNKRMEIANNVDFVKSTLDLLKK